ncbi:hypothetical protein POTOM_014646 [Populus tomentosa]|uniref:Uncharacterized protein n=1 Tax=Populus tomentosa TaxID=118781 RepID=A0A8X8A2Y7_POPTO|nr:hypothetical protein POTOM_014646 [Populus tomentosa]
MHTQLRKSGFVFRVAAASYLVGFYAKCNSFWEAEMPERDVESWNTGNVGKGVCFFVGSALVDMHGTCACSEMAKVVSEQLLRKNVVARNSLTAGYGLKGGSGECLKRFRRMSMEDRH